MTVIRILSQDDVRRALPMSQAIAAVQAGFVQLSTGRADVPLRVALDVPAHRGTTLFMPAYLVDGDQMAVKIVSVFDDNPARGLPLIHALVVVVNAETGEPAAVMDGRYLTALRTGAASGLATDLLARPDARVAAIVGAGVQGRTQLEAVCAVRAIEQAWVVDLNHPAAVAFATEMSERLGLPVQAAETPAQALYTADVVCTATTSVTPVIDNGDVRSGTHINAVGAYTGRMREIPGATVARARVVVDHRPACMAEAGDLLIAIAEGLLDPQSIVEVGEVAAGIRPARTAADEITLFKSVGIAVQDVAVASAVLTAAQELGLGSEVVL